MNVYGLTVSVGQRSVSQDVVVGGQASKMVHSVAVDQRPQSLGSAL